MKKYLMAAAAVLALSASAANARCNAEEAKANYVCHLLGCPFFHITYQQVQTLPPDSVAELMVGTVTEAEWQRMAAQGLDRAKTRAALQSMLRAMVAGASKAVVDFKTAPVSDYRCQANITFNDEAVRQWARGAVVLTILSNPLAHFQLVWAMTNQPKMFEQVLEGALANASRCLNSSPVYTEGLAFEKQNTDNCPAGQ